MATVFVERIADGIQMTKNELERELTDAQRVVYHDENGIARHRRGGEATIWRAGLNRECKYAIKVFDVPLTERRAEPEFDKLQKLQLRKCEYVPKVYGFGRLVESDGVEHPAIVEEYVHGKSLAEVLASGRLTGDARDQRFGAIEASRIALELTRAVRELKKVGLAHRDISCNNVLLSDECVNDRFANGVDLRLIDFGTSTDVARGDATALGAELRLATIPYGAPEMFGGKYFHPRYLSDDLKMAGRNSNYTDVWSIGAIIVFLMWGEYWPAEIEDIRWRQNAPGFVVTTSDAARVAEAKKKPINLIELIQQNRSVKPEDREIADVVEGCTRFKPSIRLELSQIETTLVDIIEEWGREGIDDSVPPDTPKWEDPTALECLKSKEASSSSVGLGITDSVEVLIDTEYEQASDEQMLIVEQGVLLGCHPSCRRLAFGDDVTRIGKAAFEGHEELTEVIFPKSLKRVTENAFKDCRSLKSIRMPGVKRVDNGAFHGCTSLERVYLPHVKRVGDNAFKNCTSLESVVMPVVAKVGTYYSEENGAFQGCLSLKSIHLPRLKQLGGYAFKECTALESVNMPVVTEVGYSCFRDCTALTEVNAPSVLKLENEAFKGCSSLKSVHLPLVEELRLFIFVDCTSLEGVDLPRVEKVCAGAFRGCSSLRDIDMPSVKEIASVAFYGCASLKRVSMSTVKTLGNLAFGGCSSLMRISIPSVTQIGDQAFNQCVSLEEVSAPANVRAGLNAFSGCTRLKPTGKLAPKTSTTSSPIQIPTTVSPAGGKDTHQAKVPLAPRVHLKDTLRGPKLGITIRPGIAHYSWDELKRISLAIAATGIEKEGLRIARDYHLVNQGGSLLGDVKPLELVDGTKTGVRILGFLHDTLTFGEASGISFEFADARFGCPMGYTHNGWKGSEMRRWLNNDFLKLLPDSLRPLVETTAKMTCNKKPRHQNDTSSVTRTTDRLWLPSISEVYGGLTLQDSLPMPAIRNAEGKQYQLCTKPLRGSLPIAHLTCAAHVGRMAART